MTTTRYEQTVQLIEAYIEANKLTIGDRLPTETEIARMAGVSLITVRHAMTELAQAGFIRREQGRGTFVQARRIDAETTRLGGLSDTLDAVGSLTTEVLSVARVDASPVQRSALALDLGDKVWEVRRLRRIDGEPAALEVACVPAKRAPGLDKQVQRDPAGSLYRLLAERYGLEEAYEEQALVVRRPDPEYPFLSRPAAAASRRDYHGHELHTITSGVRCLLSRLRHARLHFPSPFHSAGRAPRARTAKSGKQGELS